MWYCPIGFAITFVIGLLVSWIGIIVCGRDDEVKDPDLFFPVIANRMRKREIQEPLSPYEMSRKYEFSADSIKSDKSSTKL